MSTWKAVERQIATILGGERVPITGRIRGSAPDIAHEWLSIEVKHRKKLPDWLKDAMDQAQQSNPGGQLPVVILHEHRMPFGDSLVQMKLSDFIDYFDPKST